MTTDEQIRQDAVRRIMQGVAKKTALILGLAVVASTAAMLLRPDGHGWWFLPSSILFGGILGLLNFRWLASSVQNIYLRKGATPVGSNLAAVVISLIKLSAIFVILFIVIRWQLVHIFGMVGGLSLCFFAILWEGATLMKQTTNQQQS